MAHEGGVTVDWLRENLFWIVFAALFLWMHLRMHGGHGGHGGHAAGGHGCGGGGDAPHRERREGAEDAPARRGPDAHRDSRLA